MNVEKLFYKISIIFTVIIVIISVCALCSGCASTRPIDDTIIEYQRQIDCLENRIRSYEATTEYAIRELETISGRANKIGTTIDEVIELFDEYQRTVERILQNYRTAENETFNQIEGGAYISDCPRS